MTKRAWSQAICDCQALGQAYVLITVLGCAGSTPRNHGSKMVVTLQETHDTIGGGHLEFKTIAEAKRLLQQAQDQHVIRHYPLGAKLAQCCGGRVSILFEVFTSHCYPVVLFGAGHVAQALIQILGQLPLHITWIDSRADIFPAQLPANTTKNVLCDPCQAVATLPKHAQVLIMTHDHDLDFALCCELLAQDFQKIGLIGSKTKASCFKRRYAKEAALPDKFKRVQCPIGLDSVPGKQPMEIAVSISAYLIQHYHQQRIQFNNRGLQPKDLAEHAL